MIDIQSVLSMFISEEYPIRAKRGDLIVIIILDPLKIYAAIYIRNIIVADIIDRNIGGYIGVFSVPSAKLSCIFLICFVELVNHFGIAVFLTFSQESYISYTFKPKRFPCQIIQLILPYITIYAAYYRKSCLERYGLLPVVTRDYTLGIAVWLNSILCFGIIQVKKLDIFGQSSVP